MNMPEVLKQIDLAQVSVLLPIAINILMDHKDEGQSSHVYVLVFCVKLATGHNFSLKLTHFKSNLC